MNHPSNPTAAAGSGGRADPAAGQPTVGRSRLDWRVIFGMVLTALWLGLGVAYVEHQVGWAQFGDVPVATMGNFLEGAFAPLAFLWLVVGYFLQHKELADNNITLRLQSAALEATELNARQEVFLQVARQVRGQLGMIIGFLYISSQGATADGVVTNDQQSQMFQQMSQNDPELFSRRLLETHLQIEDPERQARLFYGTLVRARHSNNFISTFERLVARAQDSDPDGLITDSLFNSGHGLIYQIAKRHQEAAPAEMREAAAGTGISV